MCVYYQQSAAISITVRRLKITQKNTARPLGHVTMNFTTSQHEETVKKTRTQHALELYDSGTRPGEAARLAGVSESALYAARRRRDAKKTGRCPCCGGKNAH
jgi:hypothetical protein